jgi:hypothetical protein
MISVQSSIKEEDELDVVAQKAARISAEFNFVSTALQSRAQRRAIQACAQGMTQRILQPSKKAVSKHPDSQSIARRFLHLQQFSRSAAVRRVGRARERCSRCTPSARGRCSSLCRVLRSERTRTAVRRPASCARVLGRQSCIPFGSPPAPLDSPHAQISVQHFMREHSTLVGDTRCIEAVGESAQAAQQLQP